MTVQVVLSSSTPPVRPDAASSAGPPKLSARNPRAGGASPRLESRLAISPRLESELSKECPAPALSGAEFTRGMLAEAREGRSARPVRRPGPDHATSSASSATARKRPSICAGAPVGRRRAISPRRCIAPTKFRAFRGGRIYAGERMALDSRAKRAIANKSDTGKRIAHQEWVAWEWETLCRLHDARRGRARASRCSSGRDPDGVRRRRGGCSAAAAPRRARAGRRRGGARAAAAQRRDLSRPAPRARRSLRVQRAWHAERPWIIDVPQSLTCTRTTTATSICAATSRTSIATSRATGCRCGDFAERAWSRYQLGR